MLKRMALNPKQQRFVEEYLVDLNATQAAIRAGYSEKTAGVIGYENLKKPQIQSAIAAKQSERSAACGVTREWVISGLSSIANTSDKDSSRVRAYELLGKHIGMFGDTLEVGIKGRLIIEEVVVE